MVRDTELFKQLYILIPGSSRYIKFLPFGRVFVVNKAQTLHTWKIYRYKMSHPKKCAHQKTMASSFTLVQRETFFTEVECLNNLPKEALSDVLDQHILVSWLGQNRKNRPGEKKIHETKRS